MVQRSATVEVSAIIPVGERCDDIAALYAEYSAGINALGRSSEMIFVLDGPRPEAASALRQLAAQEANIVVVALSRVFGEATALMAGFEHASGGIVLTLPAYSQIEGADIVKLVAGLDSAELVVGRRWPRAGGSFEKLRRRIFHGLLSSITHLRFSDLGCGARAMKRAVLEEISLYGDQHRFIAVLAYHQGFRTVEVDVRQSPHDRFQGVYGPREYTRSVLDIFTVFFLTRFTKKPLRFFGMAGVSTFAIGALLVLLLVVQKLFFNMPLADRPALLLSSLLVVLGLQVFAIGLLGELMIFTHARQMKDYQIESVTFGGRTGAPAPALHDRPQSRAV